MQRRTHRIVKAAALALAAIVIADPRCRAETPVASKLTVPAAAHDKPTVPFWHVWTDEKGVSHQKRDEMSAFEFQSISPGAAPSWQSFRNRTATALPPRPAPRSIHQP